MEKEKSIHKNYVFNLAYQIFTLLVPFITTPYIARVLGAGGIGQYSYTYSITTYFVLFATLGTNYYGFREVARVRDNINDRTRLFWELTFLRIITTLISCIAFLGFVFINGKDIKIFFVCGISILVVIVDSGWFLQAMENFKSLVVRNIFVKLLSVVCIFTFVRSKGDLVTYILIQTGTIFIGNLVLVSKIKVYLGKCSFNTLKIRQHFGETLIYFIPTIATSIYTVLDKTMIGIITKSRVENGYYEQTYRIITIVLTIIISLNLVVGARTSYLFGNNEFDKIKKLVNKTFQYMTILAFPIFFGIEACANTFVPWFLGSGFSKVTILLRIFAPLIIIIGISNIIGELYLTPSGQRKKSGKVIVLGCVINFLMNLVLIKQFNAVGAAVSSVISELVITILYIVLSSRFIDYKLIARQSIRYLICSIIMFIPVLIIGQVMPPTIITTAIQGIMGIGIYFGILLILKDSFLMEMFTYVKDKFVKGEKN